MHQFFTFLLGSYEESRSLMCYRATSTTAVSSSPSPKTMYDHKKEPSPIGSPFPLSVCVAGFPSTGGLRSIQSMSWKKIKKRNTPHPTKNQWRDSRIGKDHAEILLMRWGEPFGEREKIEKGNEVEDRFGGEFPAKTSRGVSNQLRSLSDIPILEFLSKRKGAITIPT